MVCCGGSAFSVSINELVNRKLNFLVLGGIVKFSLTNFKLSRIQWEPSCLLVGGNKTSTVKYDILLKLISFWKNWTLFLSPNAFSCWQRRFFLTCFLSFVRFSLNISNEDLELPSILKGQRRIIYSLTWRNNFLFSFWHQGVVTSLWIFRSEMSDIWKLLVFNIGAVRSHSWFNSSLLCSV